MNHSGDVAEQIVKMSLEGFEIAAKITGSGAKNIAVMLYSILKNQDKNKIKGRARLTSMLRSGKELKVFTVSEENLKQFTLEAKRYGIVYCALRGKNVSNDGLVDVMVRAEDASKINRIVERFKLATVDTASIKNEIVQSKNHKNEGKEVPKKDVPVKSDEDKLLDESMSKPQQKEASSPMVSIDIQNPDLAKATKSSPSEPTSERQSKSERGINDNKRKSVREKIREIRLFQRKETDMPLPEKTNESKKTPSKKGNEHIHPVKNNKKSKPKKAKER